MIAVDPLSVGDPEYATLSDPELFKPIFGIESIYGMEGCVVNEPIEPFVVLPARSVAAI